MKIGKKDLFIQIKYSEILTDQNDISRYFLGFGGELYLSAEEALSFEVPLLNKIYSFAKKESLSLKLHMPIVKIDYSKPLAALEGLSHVYKKVTKLCRILDIRSVVAHAEFDQKVPLPLSHKIEGAILFWDKVCGEFGRHGISINLENHYEPDPDCLIFIMEKIGSPFLSMCFDPGHVNAFSSISIWEWVDRYPSGSIAEVHLADNMGDGDTHLALGAGNIDFDNFFKVMENKKERPFYVLEPRECEESGESLSFLKKGGFLE